MRWMRWRWNEDQCVRTYSNGSNLRPILAKNGDGAFVQLNSVASLKCASNFATHSASKAAAYSITQALRELLARQGTTVLSVHPGLIATEWAAAGLAGTAAPPSVVAEGIVRALRSGDFHLFPDPLARRIGNAYRSFSEKVIEFGHCRVQGGA